jgi:hypothetical protein
MNQGWIKLWRKIQDNPVWQHKPYSYGQAWVDLLLLANHEAHCIWPRGIRLDLEAGQVGYSKESLAAKWGWSRGRVTRFLNMLENAQQIVQQKDNVTTVITITNWKPHQETDGKQYSRRTAGGPQADTNKNEKNEENEKKSSCYAEALRLAELLLELIVQRKGDLRRPNLDRWARDMDRLIRLDGRTPERIEAVIRFCQRDPFWQNNILSVATLRRQFDRLELLMQQRRPAESTADIVARMEREGKL